MSLTPDIERVLSEHIRLVGRRDLREHCKCGWVSEDSPPFAAHRAHLAEQIAALVEQAEGDHLAAFLAQLPGDLFSETEIQRVREWAGEWSG